MLIIQYPSEIEVKYPYTVKNEINCLNANCTMMQVTEYTNTGAEILFVDISACVSLFLVFLFLLKPKYGFIPMFLTGLSELAILIVGSIALSEKCRYSTCFDNHSFLYVQALVNLLVIIVCVFLLFCIGFYEMFLKDYCQYKNNVVNQTGINIV